MAARTKIYSAVNVVVLGVLVLPSGYHASIRCRIVNISHRVHDGKVNRQLAWPCQTTKKQVAMRSVPHTTTYR